MTLGASTGDDSLDYTRFEINGKPSEMKLDTLTRVQKFGYSIGHFQNDLTAACWFNYVLYFMESVVFKGNPDSAFYAGIVLLSGQIADGLATPVVGVLSDKTKTRLGKRLPWYIFGFILVTISFVFIFQECLLCQWFDSNTQSMKTFYYVFFPSAFNVGWAAVQVAHMSLVPSLTLSRKTRDQLNNQRNTFTYIANLFVLGFAVFLFEILNDAFLQFKVLALGSLGLGIVSSFVFLFTVNEKQLTKDCKAIKKQLQLQAQMDPSRAELLKDRVSGIGRTNENENDSPGYPASETLLKESTRSYDMETSQNSPMLKSKNNADEDKVSWTYWFKLPSFYLYGVVYMGVRMLVNVQSSLIIFYLENILMIKSEDENSGLPREFAIIPMIVYLSSTVVSSFLKIVYEKIGRKKAFTLGAFAALFGTTIMMFLDAKLKNFMYPLAIVIGIGQSISLNTGISLIGEVVGSKGSSGAFVFGAYSLLDKFSSGIVLYLVVNLRNIKEEANMDYLRLCTCLIPAGSVLVAWLLALSGKAADYDQGDLVTDNQDQEANQSLLTNDKL